MHNPGVSRRGIADSHLPLGRRHCEERSDEAIHPLFAAGMDCFASLAMYGSLRAFALDPFAKLPPTPRTPDDRKIPMARVRCITEMGMGVDVHGKDATKAARRAVSDAIRHSSLGFFRMLGKTSSDMFVDVTIGVPDPGAVDTSAVAKELPYGTVTVSAVKGGLKVDDERGGDAIIIANAAVIVSLDDGKPG